MQRVVAAVPFDTLCIRPQTGGSNMRNFKKFFSKWYIQLFLVLLTTVMGLIGYYIYYQSQKPSFIPAALRIQTFFSTLRLFTLKFDVKDDMFKAGIYPDV